MVYIIPLVAFVLGLGAGFWAYRNGNARLGLAGVVVLVASFVGTVMAGRGHQGWDGIGYAIVAVLMIAPVAIGLLAGLGLGWLRRRSGGR